MKKKRQKENEKYRERKLWKKCMKFIISLSMMRVERSREEKESKQKKGQDAPEQGKRGEQIGKWLFLSMLQRDL